MPLPPTVTLRKSQDSARKNKPWMLDISKGISQSGKREFRYFSCRTQAEREKKRILRNRRDHGMLAVHIGPDLAAEALKQAERLKPYGASLCEAVTAYTALRDRQAASASFAEGWQIYEKLKENRSHAHLSQIRSIGRKVPGSFKRKLLCDITPEEIRGILHCLSAGPHKRNQIRAVLRNFFNEMIVEGYLDKNPVERVRREEIERDGDIRVLTVEELQQIFAACKDYRLSEEEYDRRCSEFRKQSLDCRQCAVPFAILAFAGIRPAELERLEWRDISLEMRNIRISGSKSKTRTRRNVDIEENLCRWLATVPENQRTGQVVPGDWRRKRARVMKATGLSEPHSASRKKLSDVFRHSYGSYYLGAFNNLEKLKANMGHSHVQTFFAHYHNDRTKRESLPWWAIGPGGQLVPCVLAA